MLLAAVAVSLPDAVAVAAARGRTSCKVVPKPCPTPVEIAQAFWPVGDDANAITNAPAGALVAEQAAPTNRLLAAVAVSTSDAVAVAPV